MAPAKAVGNFAKPYLTLLFARFPTLCVVLCLLPADIWLKVYNPTALKGCGKHLYGHSTTGTSSNWDVSYVNLFQHYYL